MTQFLAQMSDLSGINFGTVGVEGSNGSSKMKSIVQTTWPPEAQNSPINFKKPKGGVNFSQSSLSVVY